jgi:hypothetical protein
MKFKESNLAHQLLDGLKGIEIGGSAHNPFGLDTINVDRYSSMDTVFKLAEIELNGEALPVDIVAPGDRLPCADKSYDFIISSHVIEHFVFRVRFYPTDTDETFDGTVIDEKPNYYVVIPDQNLQLTQNWNKRKCDVLR